VRAAKQRGDVVVLSIHWGSNWGHGVDRDQVRFAHRLIDGGINLIHGHSSHHPRPDEVYRGRLALYGCGDCIDDYKGISGHEKYRDDLRLPYFVSVAPDTGTLAALQMVPMQARKMRLHRAKAADSEWRAMVLERISRGFGSRIDRQPGGTLVLHPTAGDGRRFPSRPRHRQGRECRVAHPAAPGHRHAHRGKLKPPPGPRITITVPSTRMSAPTKQQGQRPQRAPASVHPRV
jgi:Bacterial capsule synthesis protein PGA_cap